MKRFSLIELMMVIAITALTLLFFGTVPADARGKSGVWPVQLVEEGTFTSGADSGASIFVIDFTAKNAYTGNVIGQFTGVTLSGLDDAIAGTTLWPCALETGISVYYANLLAKPESGSSVFDLANWNLISATGSTLRSGNTYYAFDIPWDPAAPYGALKFVWSGASQFKYGFRYATSGNP